MRTVVPRGVVLPSQAEERSATPASVPAGEQVAVLSSEEQNSGASERIATHAADYETPKQGPRDDNASAAHRKPCWHALPHEGSCVQDIRHSTRATFFRASHRKASSQGRGVAPSAAALSCPSMLWTFIFLATWCVSLWRL